MKLLFIHGPPGAGKLTTAKTVVDRIGGRLFDNHSAIDLARTVFDFGAPGFWELVQAMRILVLASAAERRLPLLLTTSVYTDPVDLPTFEQLEAVIQQHGGQMLPVFLQCPVDAIVERIGNEDRAIRNKMTSEKSVRPFIDMHRIVPVPRSNCLVLNSQAGSAEENAQQIIRHFGLVDQRQ